MAKKQKKTAPERTPTKRQLSKWERQMKIRRIVIIAAVIFVAGVLTLAGLSVYQRGAAMREVVIRVNDAKFNMGYYVKMLDIYTRDMEPMMVYYMADRVAGNIIESELLKQGGGEMGIGVTRSEIDARMKEWEVPDEAVYRDIMEAILYQEKLGEHFEAGLPDEMEQAHVQVMLVESEEVAEEALTAFEVTGNFTPLVDEFSRYPAVEGDLGWLPEELMPQPLIAEVAFDDDMEPGQVSPPIYDETVTKSIGYWLIEVLDVRDEEDEEEAPEGSIQARAILLGSRVEAERVRAELEGGNFTALAKEYSQHQSKEFGGALGWIGPGDMDSTAFDTVAFTLAAGELSQPVRDESIWTTGGYWLVHVVDRGERELDEEVREQLVDRRIVDWIEEQRENATIEDNLDEEKIWVAVEEVTRRR